MVLVARQSRISKSLVVTWHVFKNRPKISLLTGRLFYQKLFPGNKLIIPIRHRTERLRNERAVIGQRGWLRSSDQIIADDDDDDAPTTGSTTASEATETILISSTVCYIDRSYEYNFNLYGKCSGWESSRFQLSLDRSVKKEMVIIPSVATYRRSSGRIFIFSW